MAREQTLLERLRSGAGPSSHTAVENTNALVRSVQANLARILNAREGHAPAQMDYGVPCPSDVVHDYPHSIGVMQRRIKDSLEKYEPRLKDIEVIHIENENGGLVLRYQVQGRLATSETESWITFLTQMDPSGRISLKR